MEQGIHSLSANALRGLPGGFTRSKPNRLMPAIISFAGFVHDNGDNAKLRKNARQAFTDLRDYMRNEFRRFPHQPQAKHYEKPKLQADSQVVDLR